MQSLTMINFHTLQRLLAKSLCWSGQESTMIEESSAFDWVDSLYFHCDWTKTWQTVIRKWGFAMPFKSEHKNIAATLMILALLHCTCPVTLYHVSYNCYKIYLKIAMCNNNYYCVRKPLIAILLQESSLKLLLFFFTNNYCCRGS